jgi:fatty-acyl-CoA synthase
MYNLALLHEAIAAAVPERECIVFRDRRLSWSAVRERTRRLGALLREHGLGCRRERAQLANWESGQDHVALYLFNGNEYLEGMLGAFKARCAPFNVNYRYVEEELRYLFDNADARCVIYHASFAPLLEKLRPELARVRLWLQVADESGHTLLPGALDYEAALAAAPPAEPVGLSPDDLYILYTGGTTGMPKGVLWRQHDIYLAALAAGGAARSLAELQERVRARPGIRVLPAPPFMHGASHWAAFNMWHTGGAVIVQSQPRHLDADDLWSTAERERANALVIVGDAFARPLVDQLRRKRYDLADLKVVTSGGAIFTAKLKRELLELLPQVRIRDTLGASETGSQGVRLDGRELPQRGEGGAQMAGFEIDAQSVVLKEDLSGLLEPGSEQVGWLAKSGNVPLGYFGDEQKTARTFPTLDGVRYSVPGDRARVAADGSLTLLGRDAVTINSGGEKIFAEEVELALKHHPQVYDAVVCGTPSERWGAQVTAIVQLRAGATPRQDPTEDALRAAAAEHIAAYKLPKAFVYVEAITRAPSGKADYRWAAQTAAEALRRRPDAGS